MLPPRLLSTIPIGKIRSLNRIIGKSTFGIKLKIHINLKKEKELKKMNKKSVAAKVLAGVLIALLVVGVLAVPAGIILPLILK